MKGNYYPHTSGRRTIGDYGSYDAETLRASEEPIRHGDEDPCVTEEDLRWYEENYADHVCVFDDRARVVKIWRDSDGSPEGEEPPHPADTWPEPRDII